MAPDSVHFPFAFDEPIRTPRLLLRPVGMHDVDDIYAYQSDPDVCRYIGFPKRSYLDVAEKVELYASCTVLADDGDFLKIAIERRDAPGRLIGDVFFRLVSVEHATGEVGWTCHPAFQGRGYLTEAVRAVLDLAFDWIGLHRVIADIDIRNDRSAAMCSRLSMRQEALFAEAQWLEGAWSDRAIHALLAHEHRAATAALDAERAGPRAWPSRL
jgi:RimJ/RimL family protein N-acetyltransferase